MKATRIFILAIIIISVWSCKKQEKLNIPLENISLDEQITIRDIRFINDQIGFACGGVRDESGYVFKTIDGGATWSTFTMPFPKCVYSIQVFSEDTIMVGADDTFIFYTTDGNNWQTQWHDSEELPFHENNRPAIKNIQFLNDTLGYFVGGENFNKGVIYKTIDGGDNWSFDTLFHEMRGMHFINENEGFFSGYGYVGKTTDGAISFEQVEIDRDFYMSIQQLSNGSIITVSNTGDVLKSMDSGTTWNRVLKGNKLFGRRVGYNQMLFEDETGFIVGNDGIILASSDFGESWKKIDYSGKENFNAVHQLNNMVYVAGENGKILKFSKN